MANTAIAKADPHEELERLDKFYDSTRSALAEQIAVADRLAAEKQLAADDAKRTIALNQASELARLLMVESVVIDRLLQEASERMATRRSISREIARIAPDRPFGNVFEHSNVVVSAVTASGVGHFMRLSPRGAMRLQDHDASRLNSFDLKGGMK
jgi:hypothetical protein